MSHRYNTKHKTVKAEHPSQTFSREICFKYKFNFRSRKKQMWLSRITRLLFLHTSFWLVVHFVFHDQHFEFFPDFLTSSVSPCVSHFVCTQLTGNNWIPCLYESLHCSSWRLSVLPLTAAAACMNCRPHCMFALEMQILWGFFWIIFFRVSEKSVSIIK